MLALQGVATHGLFLANATCRTSADVKGLSGEMEGSP